MSKFFLKIDKARWLDGFSEETIRQLSDVLKVELNRDNEKIEDCIFDLYSAKSSAMSIEEVSNPKLMKGRYTKTLSAIRTLEKSLSAFHTPEIETLSDLIEGFEADETLAKFDCSKSNSDINGVYGITIYETRQQLTVLARAIEHALSRIKVPRGAKPKEHERYLALYVKEALEDRKITLSTYDDGIYFKVLAILFEECFDNSGAEAHRRHGAFALKCDLVDIDEHDIKYLPPGSVDTQFPN